MEIAISGRHLDTGEAFKTHVTAALDALRTKYCERAIRASATLGSGPRGSGFTCEVAMHAMADVLLKGSGDGRSANAAFDAAAQKVEKQLRRYMRRLHARGGAPTAAGPDAEASYTIFEAPTADTDEPGDAPLVVAEAQVDVPSASVADAVMMLDLRNTTALLFKNTRTGSLNMVYRRDDGNIGWVEPAQGWRD